ncbi:GntR family transcriptional regulator [Sporosarcina sp. FSL W7-1349]|uniref:GntR family transcriptional regulator n=1 Tax=Sporosarcina sp. FSL W7-1349 TaxID=2921561 RepID=UPI0030FAC620
MSSSSQVNRMSTSDIAYEEIKKKIIEMQYDPQQHLIEEQLSEDLSVSRTPLRQALYRLILEGLLVKQSNGRIHVAPISLSEMEEIYRVREVLEGLLSKEAALNMTEPKLKELEDIIVLMKLSAEQQRNEHLIMYGSQFHSVLYSLSTNQTAKRFMEQINTQVERYRRVGLKSPSYSSAVSILEHEKIIKLIRENKPDEVETEMRLHISRRFQVAKETVEMYLEP